MKPHSYYCQDPECAKVERRPRVGDRVHVRYQQERDEQRARRVQADRDVGRLAGEVKQLTDELARKLESAKHCNCSELSNLWELYNT